MTRALLVLDLNGVLVHRVRHGDPVPDTAVRPPFMTVARTRVYMRRSSIEFIEWALARFQVAVWTSARLDNAAPIMRRIFGAQWSHRLTFAWGQEQCDTLLRKDVTRIRRAFPDTYDRVAVVDDTPAKILGLDDQQDRLFSPDVARETLEHFMNGTATADGRLALATVVHGRTLSEWGILSHQALAKHYGWTTFPPRPNTFGFNNLVSSAASMLATINAFAGVDAAAAAVHAGWVTNYRYWRDHMPHMAHPGTFAQPGRPLGDARRNACADAAFDDLDDDEKEKDRIVARAILDSLWAA